MLVAALETFAQRGLEHQREAALEHVHAIVGESQLLPADNTGPRQISVPRSELAPLLA
jgi:hypothetical protein